MTRTRKRERTTPALTSLRWLSVVYTSLYKILASAYKTLHRTLPQDGLLTRSLRSEPEVLLTVPQVRGLTLGNRYFGNAAATLWNNLPANNKKRKPLDAFKKMKINLLIP